MAYLALYRKYRPTDFDEVAGQKEIIKVLKNSIENNKVSHAYLFSGPRGTGKTTSAKIISKLVNCENLVDGKLCGKCRSCLSVDNNDIIEIDAASNNGVDEIREIRDNANLVPSNCKYKIYIIDEVHMLTTQAFNALLKTLEEPPKHIIFILATTEYYKIPLTVVSRCQRFQFNKLTENEIVSRLKYISGEEKIDITDEALCEISRIADGAMRDAINLLDQLNSYKNGSIDIDDVYNVCEIVSSKELVSFLSFIKNNDSKCIIEFIENINNKGYNLNKFIEEIIYFLKDCLVFNFNADGISSSKINYVKDVNNLFSYNEINGLISGFNDIVGKLKNTNYPSIILIVEVLNLIKKDNVVEEKVVYVTKNESVVDKKEDKIEEVAEVVEKKEEVKEIKAKFNDEVDEFKRIRINNTFATADKKYLIELKNNWSKILDYILDDNYGSLVGILKDANPIVVGEKNIILLSDYDNISDRINDDYKLIEEFISKVFGSVYNVICLNKNEWEIEKNKFMENKKNNVVYTYIEEKKDDEEVHDSVSELIDIVGEDMIEFI